MRKPPGAATHLLTEEKELGANGKEENRQIVIGDGSADKWAPKSPTFLRLEDVLEMVPSLSSANKGVYMRRMMSAVSRTGPSSRWKFELE